MSTIDNVSDTARWVAVYRAMESDRPDAHFRDPYARRLAGDKGPQIVAAMPQGRTMAWPMIVRTQVMDEIIMRLVREQRVDMVLNLAAGLDARPWRLDLPPELRWVDVDLPGILGYKTGVMDGETPRCRYEAARCDLTSATERDALFARLGAEAGRALVVTEGLLVYLTADDVASLAGALHAQPGFRWWLTDLASPRLLKWMHKRWGKEVSRAPFRFGPAESGGWFAPYGWREAEWHSVIADARRLKREMRGAWLSHLLISISPAKKREEWNRFSGTLLLERT